MRTILILTCLLLTAPALASHSETHETGWFEYVYNEDDDAVLYCNALNYITVAASASSHEGTLVDEAIYIHDRPGPDAPYGTGMVSEGGGGTWVWQESNGVKGLQIGVTPIDVPWPLGEIVHTDGSFPEDCPNGDTVLF